MNNEDLELKYHDITELYDLAEDLVATVESEFVADPNEQLELVEPLIESVGEAADILCEEFIGIAEAPKKSKSRRNKIEGALRKIYVAIDAYNEQVKKKTGSVSKSLRNVADPIVEKIKRQVEVVISHFIDFVEISLDRIMQKAQLEELKRRQEKIALMLHSLSQQTSLDHG